MWPAPRISSLSVRQWAKKNPGTLGTNQDISPIKFGRFSHIRIAQNFSKIKKYFFDEKLISKILGGNRKIGKSWISIENFRKSKNRVKLDFN